MVGVVGLALLAVCQSGLAVLSAQEARGKQIYVTGTTASGREIAARVGSRSIPVPASAVVCAGCHGGDGLGRSESGVYPSDIRWSRLTKAYGAVSPGGRRRHPPYDEMSLKHALLAGLDPGNNRLDSAMPRFEMAGADLDDLISYLKRLESDLDPGLDRDRIVLGTVMPRSGPMAQIGAAITAVMSAYFGDLNGTGGVYGRRIELRVARADTREQSIERARDLVEGQQVFALIGALSGPANPAFVELAEEHRVPFIGPFTQSTGADIGLRRHTFYLLADPYVQGRALVDYASGRLPVAVTDAAVVHRNAPELNGLADDMAQRARHSGWGSVRQVAYPPAAMEAGRLVSELESAGVRALFFLGADAEFQLLARAAHEQRWAPKLFMHGYLSARGAMSAPLSFRDRIYLAYPTSPRDHSPDGRREFGEFHARHRLSRQHLSAQITAYCAAKVLVRGLERSGRQLGREKLIEALEGLYEYSTGLSPPLTFGPNRRMGALGAYIVSVDLAERQFSSHSTWVEPR
ncbi:MAG: ABC transporter substrate-binding protein [Gammaproteobacteria bacterium]